MFTRETHERAAELIASKLGFMPFLGQPIALVPLFHHAATAVLGLVASQVSAAMWERDAARGEADRVGNDAEVELEGQAFALANARGEIQNLRLAILGGEDAPGVAMSLPLTEVMRIHRANVGEANYRAEAAENRADRLAAAFGRLIADVEARVSVGEATPAYVMRATSELLACSAPATSAPVVDEPPAERFSLHDNGRQVWPVLQPGAK